MFYYINSAGQQAGPVPADQLAANGITADTLVWKDGMSQWTKASDVPELRFLFDPNVPPPAPSNSTNTAISQDSNSKPVMFAVIVGIVGVLVLLHWLFGSSGFWIWLFIGVLTGELFSLWKAIFEKKTPEKGTIWATIIIAVIGYFVFSSGSTTSSDSKKESVATESTTTPVNTKKEIPSWMVGKWKCNTPYGTITLRINSDGFGTFDDSFGNFTYTGDELEFRMSNVDGVVTPMEVDHANHRLGAGSGYYFRKVSN